MAKWRKTHDTNLFGTFQVLLDGEPVTGFRSDKSRALLTYLVVEHGRPHRREALAALLWGESATRDARASLRSTLYNLRQVLASLDEASHETPLLTVTRQDVQFNAVHPACWVDKLAFDVLLVEHKTCQHRGDRHDKVCVRRMARMSDLYRGDFLYGLNLQDSAEFEEWRTVQQERYHRETLQALGLLIKHHRVEGDYAKMARYAQRQIALEPWLEAPHRALMMALAFQGQRSAALAQYAACRETLQAELDLAPDDETTALYQKIRDGALGWEGGPGVPPENPYRGLEAFGRKDAANFFGRESLVDRLLARLGVSEMAPGKVIPWEARFVALIGPSGSGKSSVVQAGLIPQVLRITAAAGTPWHVAQMRPGADPVAALAAALQASLPVDAATEAAGAAFEQALRNDTTALARILATHLAPGQVWLLVLDQAEEFFTLVPDQATIDHFSELLLAALQAPEGHMRQITLMRADYYALPLEYPAWGKLFQARLEVTLPLMPEELRRAIVGPAERLGIVVEPELVAQMVADAGQTWGALPLLQYTLTELFERQAGNRMTHSAYQDLGGIAGALARRAEELYDQLDAPAQQVARQVFLRLVVPQETGVTVRQKVTRDALFSLAHPVSAGGETLQTVPAAAVQTVLDTFGRYRLLTFDRDAVTDAPTVEIAHEMLTEAWQSLRVWVTEAQETLYRHRRLEALAAAWERAQRDPSYLLRGRRLAQFEELPTATGLALSATEAAYLKASLHAREARRQQEAARQAHEAELERHIQGRRRALTWVLAVATAVALSLAAYAFVQRRSALDSQRRAEREVVISESLSLSTRAQLAGYNNDTDLAIALAWQANRIEEPPSQVQLILSDVAYAPGTRRVFTGHDGSVTSVTATADGQHLLSASGDSTLILWDVQTGEIVRRFQGHTDAVHSVVLLPGDQQALSASADGSLILWNLATGDIVRRFEGHTGAVRCVTLSPVPLPETGHLAALSGSEDTSLILWDVNTGEIVQRFEGHTGAVVSLAISPDVVPATGRHVALSGAMDRGLIFWDFPGGAILYNKSGYETTMDALDDAQQNGHFDVVWAVGFTSGGQAFSASQDENVMLWDLETGMPEKATHLAAGLFGGVAGTGGATVILGTLNSQVLVVDAGSGQVLLDLHGHTSRVLALALMPDKRGVASGGDDGTVRLWDLSGGAEVRILPYPGALVAATAVDIAPDQRRGLVAWMDNSISVWDMDSGAEVCRLRGHGEMPFAGAAFLPDSRHVASGSGDIYGPSEDNTVRLWDAETCQELEVFRGHTDRLWDIAVSPDGQWIVSGSHDGTVRLWNVAKGSGEILLDLAPLAARSVAFSPDGALVAVGPAKGTSNNPVYDVYIIERASGAQVRRLAGHSAVVTDLDFSPDGQQLLSASVNGNIILWDVARGQRLRTLAGHTNAVMTVDFHPEGRLAASGAADSSVILWDTTTGNALRRYTAQAKTIMNVVFAPDGETLFAVGDDLPDETVREIRLDTLLDALLDWVSANRYVPQLTCEQKAQYHINDPDCGETDTALDGE